MKDIAVADAAFAGFGIMRRHPLAVFVWGLLFTALVLITFLGFAAPIIRAITVMSNPELSREDPQMVLGALAGAAGGYLFFVLGALVVGAVTQAAVLRAFFHPEDSGFFYVRLGTPELWLLLTNLVQGLVIAGVQILATIPLGILTAIASMTLPEAGGLLQLVGQLLIYVLSGYVYLRLSMAQPMTFIQSRFRLFESWAMTRGHVLRLVLVWLLVLAAMVAIYFVGALVLGVSAGGLLAEVSGLKDPAAFFERPAAEWASSLAPLLAVGGLISAVVIGMITALPYAASAHVYRQINPDADTAAAFT